MIDNNNTSCVEGYFSQHSSLHVESATLSRLARALESRVVQSAAGVVTTFENQSRI